MEGRSLRLFLGLPLPPGLQEALSRWQQAQPGLKGWSRAEGLHLTLAFLGERPAEALPRLGEVSALVAGRHGAFELYTARLGGFPGERAARVLWLGLEPCPALEDLAADLRGTLQEAGEAFDAKPFRPHLTLARFRAPLPVGEFTAPSPAHFAADRLALFESRPQGCYAPLQVWHMRTV